MVNPVDAPITFGRSAKYGCGCRFCEGSETTLHQPKSVVTDKDARPPRLRRTLVPRSWSAEASGSRALCSLASAHARTCRRRCACRPTSTRPCSTSTSPRRPHTSTPLSILPRCNREPRPLSHAAHRPAHASACRCFYPRSAEGAEHGGMPTDAAMDKLVDTCLSRVRSRCPVARHAPHRIRADIRHAPMLSSPRSCLRAVLG